MRTTPNMISDLAPGEVFVFGSNLAGMHAGGAARLACIQFGAENGVGIGPSGRTYAIPTMDEQMRPMPLSLIGEHIEIFLLYAAGKPDETFLVTAIGCGIAGFNAEQIAPLFRKHAPLPANVILPASFL